jgi:hypothetical protein
MKKILEWILDFLKGIGGGGNGGNGGNGMSREEATQEVTKLYVEILHRDIDEGATGYIDSLVSGEMTVDQVEHELRGSAEKRLMCEKAVRDIYVELLGRDPGPLPGETEWRDPGALPYVDDLQWGRKTERQIRDEIKDSEEYKNKPKVLPARAFRVEGTHLFEPTNNRRYMPLSISLFYGLSLGISRQRFVDTVDGLSGKLQEARLSMSTFTWDNDQGEPEVIPFEPGDLHRGYSNKISQEFLYEMDTRLLYMFGKGVRPQVTIFWGGVQPMFRQGDGVKWNAMKDFMRPLMVMGQRHPAIKWEIINEAGHGHHWAYMGRTKRHNLIRDCARFCREVYPGVHLGVSDGGHGPREWLSEKDWVDVVESKEYGGLVLSRKGKVLMDGDRPIRPKENTTGSYFDYHSIRELSDWKVHYPRDQVLSDGIPRWSRGMWHLSGEAHNFAQKHPDMGYGQNDENIFLQTQEEHNQYPYGGATTDWKMVVSSWYVALCAKSCSTAHTHKGFFCRAGAGEDPAIKLGGPAYQEALKDFEFQGQASLNTGWKDSPIKSFDGPFKAFALVGGANRRTMIFTVLNPRQGKLRLDLKRVYGVEVREITGEIRKKATVQAGVQDFHLPKMTTEHTAIVRLTAI